MSLMDLRGRNDRKYGRFLSLEAIVVGVLVASGYIAIGWGAVSWLANL